MEYDGQLQIHWDRDMPVVRNAVEALLEIKDGDGLPQAISLDQGHLQNGFFTYARQTDRVDIKLTLHQPDGRQIRDVTTFLGQTPVARKPEPEGNTEALRKEREAAAAQAAKLKSDLASQEARTRKLEKDLQNMKDEMKQQQQRRMANQLPEGKQ
jgi:hypothetical protein